MNRIRNSCFSVASATFFIALSQSTFSFQTISTTTSFHRPSPHKLHAIQETSNYQNDPWSKDDNERAGSGGYSVLRQPLNWENEDNETKDGWKPPTEEEKRKAVSSSLDSWMKDKSTESNRNDNHKTKSDAGSNEGGGVGATDMISADDITSTQKLDLYRRTLETLDYPALLKSFMDLCETIPAKQVIAREMNGSGGEGSNRSRKTEAGRILSHNRFELSADSVDGMHSRYSGVREMQKVMGVNTEPLSVKGLKPYPLTGSLTLNLAPIFALADGGAILEGPELYEIASTLKLLKDLAEWTQNLHPKNPKTDNYFKFTKLPSWGEYIVISDDLSELLFNAFDKQGQLNGETFPGLARLRSKIQLQKRSIFTRVQEMVSNSPKLKKALALESGGSLFSDVNGRIVIPIDVSYQNANMGIIHDVSRSGKTVFVEPTEIVGPTNDLKQTEMELKAEELRVWKLLTKRVLEERDGIEVAIAAASQIDLLAARVRLGSKLEGEIPECGNEGVIQMQNARHPLLLLREEEEANKKKGVSTALKVIGSDVSLGVDDNQGLVLTGPNSGGKTVILKLLGLVALMARDGIPIPSDKMQTVEHESDALMEPPTPPRVDFFSPVLADIGDLQTIGGDLSTFSGHMLVCREILSQASSISENSADVECGKALVLMDEIGSGTDPAQGVAIAQALLEALLDSGSRVAITTHYMELKSLAASDNRFQVGGMQFLNGKPTYKLLNGVVGESFALSVAERLNLPAAVIERSKELLDSETRQMGDLLANLEDQKAVVDSQIQDLAEQQREMEELKTELKKTQMRLEQQQLNARRDEAKKFAEKLSEKEAVLEKVLERLKSDPSKKLVAKSWEDISFVKREAVREAEFTSVKESGQPQRQQRDDSMELIPITEIIPIPQPNPGETVIICKEGAFRGQAVEVLSMNGKNKIQVNVGGMKLNLKTKDVALPTTAMLDSGMGKVKPKKNKGGQMGPNGKKLNKFARDALAESDRMDMSIGVSNNKNRAGKQSSAATNFRTDSNTIDLRGCNMDEASDKCEGFFARKAMSGDTSHVFLLHGHGTGVLKQKLRDWLKMGHGTVRSYVKRWEPAEPVDGGDAFTKVELKTSKNR
mmetsp:Transcript_40284/g.47127  ORF Transcript_40284/g.47127 Transcript_40284/m.47127 type:complete len:1110 (-) Transcript_40284:160-3489(-)